MALPIPRRPLTLLSYHVPPVGTNPLLMSSLPLLLRLQYLLRLCQRAPLSQPPCQPQRGTIDPLACRRLLLRRATQRPLCLLLRPLPPQPWATPRHRSTPLRTARSRRATTTATRPSTDPTGRHQYALPKESMGAQSAPPNSARDPSLMMKALPPLPSDRLSQSAGSRRRIQLRLRSPRAQSYSSRICSQSHCYPPCRCLLPPYFCLPLLRGRGRPSSALTLHQ